MGLLQALEEENQLWPCKIAHPSIATYDIGKREDDEEEDAIQSLRALIFK